MSSFFAPTDERPDVEPACAVTLSPGEFRALADLSARHPHASGIVNTFRDDADIGWASVQFIEHRPLTYWYIVSPTGRAWQTMDGRTRGNEVRGQDYDTRPRSPR